MTTGLGALGYCYRQSDDTCTIHIVGGTYSGRGGGGQVNFLYLLFHVHLVSTSIRRADHPKKMSR